MEKVTFELDLGLGVCKEGRGPFFIHRAQMESCEVRKCVTWKSKQVSLARVHEAGRASGKLGLCMVQTQARLPQEEGQTSKSTDLERGSFPGPTPWKRSLNVGRHTRRRIS